MTIDHSKTIEAMALELDHYREALTVITHYEPSEGGDYFSETVHWKLPEKYQNMSAQAIAIKALEGAKK